MHQSVIRQFLLAALFLAIGLLLPFFTGQIPQIGSMLLPMHLPVLLCGIICGWQYGMAVGFILPVLRALLFGMPPIYPVAVAMSLEMAVYGLVIGLGYGCLPKRPGSVYLALAAAMVAGRIIWGAAQTVLLGLGGTAFTWKMFIGAAFINAVPGIILQIILVPFMVFALQRRGALSRCE